MKQLYVSCKNRTDYNIKRIQKYLNKYTVFEIAATTIILLVGLWIIISFFEIVANNLTTCKYSTWNLIDILANRF
ncbi:hypothetical protein KQI61_15535 [Anaerocolumna aminovalerica]|uniref:hypothetical protein n=1 Tax=Anaerocolumna aminovalerica TaxID=1527 RepID=UPI001C0EFAA1|nr:hypothetical protein [Anaerocolumna aminovalerica]MBU5333611.1 hypothetical protein [Anaerocolumna aminovalerica]